MHVNDLDNSFTQNLLGLKDEQFWMALTRCYD